LSKSYVVNITNNVYEILVGHFVAMGLRYLL